ncbi:MAG: aldehyde dehydrogenase [Synergistales bacterium]|nr:aldehyde dehydrogenase [Synergistales bacterium]
MRIGINGFGRIGRAIFRIARSESDVRICCINDVNDDLANHAYLLQYDSIYGKFPGKVEVNRECSSMVVDLRSIPFYSEGDMEDVPWSRHDVDLVVDSSGISTNFVSARRLVNSGVIDGVIITQIAEGFVDGTWIHGVENRSPNDFKGKVISSSICDAVAIAPVLQILDDHCGIRSVFLTTLHPWLNYQNLLDGPVSSVSSPSHSWEDFSLARGSTVSLIPKETRIVNALRQIIPELAERIQAVSFRVPTSAVTAADLTLVTEKDVAAEEIINIFSDESRKKQPVIGLSEEPLVSIDFLKVDTPVVDSRWIRVHDKRHLKLLLWYDNEWTYSRKVIDLIRSMGNSLI